MPILFAVVFLGLVGFGIVLPPLPFVTEALGAKPAAITIILATYSIGQFLAAPLWGRVSDTIGRKPVLMISLAASCAGYVILGIADSVEMIAGARLFSGLMAGNLSAAFAYVADVTTTENRSKGMGILGAAAGLGFIFGPAIGGFLSGPSPEAANFTMVAWVAGGMAFGAFLATVFFLPESLKSEDRKPWKRTGGQPRMAEAKVLFSRTVLLFLIASSFLIVFSQSMMESTFALFGNRRFGFGPQDVGYVFAGIGIVAAAVQGGGIGWLSKRYSEKALTIAGMLLCGVGTAGLGLSTTLAMMWLSCAVMAAGFGVFSPALSSLVSHQAGDRERGSVMGLYQSSQSLGRLTAPLISGVIFAEIGIGAPMILAAFLCIPGVLLVMLAMKQRSGETVGEPSPTATKP